MANLTITASAVIPSASATLQTGFSGVAIAAGEVIYKDTGDSNKLKLADANDASAIVRTVAGIAVNSAAAGQPVTYASEDPDLTLGAMLFEAGDAFILSATPGKIAPVADLATGMYPTFLGFANSDGKINFKPFAGTVVAA